MPGDGDINQLSLIFQNLGTPTEQQWPGMKVHFTSAHVVPGDLGFHGQHSPVCGCRKDLMPNFLGCATGAAKLHRVPQDKGAAAESNIQRRRPNRLLQMPLLL